MRSLVSRAISRIQSAVVIVIIVFAVVSLAVLYLLMSHDQPISTIKIGLIADLDGTLGKNALQGAILAAEQLNAEGGLLGREIEVIGEDNDIESGLDMEKVTNALNRLITYHKVDFILGSVDGEAGLVCQDIVANHEKIFFGFGGTSDALTQRVLDDYDRYKYYFRNMYNATSVFQGVTDSLCLLREQTGFNRVAYLAEDAAWTKGIMAGLDYVLPEIYGFELVYKGSFPLDTFDFSSYFAQAEAAGAEILMPLIGYDGGIPFVKEWYDRQSPMVVYGGVLMMAAVPESWDWTDGKCNHVVTSGSAIMTGYPLTNETLPAREAYINRWNEEPMSGGALAFDILRYILPDAIRRAGTIKTEQVIEALEETRVETSNARNFVFTTSHDAMMGENLMDPDEDYQLIMLFQWQNGRQVPVYPKKVMEEAGATLTFPDWPGPWD